MKKIFLIIVFVIFSSLLSTSAFAHITDLNIDCGDSGCTKSGTDPLFSTTTDGPWYPGRIVTKIINLKNSSSSSKEMDLAPSRTSSSSILENVIQISIVTNPGGLVIWGGSLADFYNQSRINMGTFSIGSGQDYNFTASMNSSADNNYQNLDTVFDLTLGFWEEETQIPTPTPTTAPGGAVAGATTGGGGGGGGGAAAPTCNDAAPASAPTLLSAVAGTNSVTLTWSAASDPVSYYLVAYGVSPNSSQYGNPNVGGKGTTSYTISGLSGTSTYCFVVRAGNGCMPGNFSNTICTTPSGGFIAAAVAPGFTAGVLGASTGGLTPTRGPTEAAGSVKGVSLHPCQCLWWQILLGELLACIVYYFLFIKKYKEKIKKFTLIGLVIPLLTYLVYLWINRVCFGGFKLVILPQTKYFFCRYFLIIDFVLYTFAGFFLKEKKQSFISEEPLSSPDPS